MNSRSGVNESSLVNFSSDLPSLDAKDSLLSFPFDHLYACHSDTPDQTEALQLVKDIGLPAAELGADQSTGAADSPDVKQLNDRLTQSENQNKKLKDLLVFHLDLIQQQNELITKRDRLFLSLQKENESLKTKLGRRPNLNLPPPAPLPPPPPLAAQPAPPPQPAPAVPALPPPVTPAVVKTEPGQIMLNSFTELLLTDNRSNSYLFDGDLGPPKKFEKETFGLARTTTPSEPDVKPFLHSELAGQPILEATKSKYTNPRCEGFKAVDSKRSLIKKDALKPEPRSEPLYTITSTSGNPVIQRVQRKKKNSTGVGHLNRMPKKTPKVETPEPSKTLDVPAYDHFGINRKSKMINTYGKARTATTCTATSTTSTMAKSFGSLSDRLQLIDTTPTGEDPYQLGEADLREQSPIPKLMLQKTNHGRMRVLDQPTRRIYDPDSPEPKQPRMRTNRFLSSTFTADLKKEAKTMIIQEPDLDLVKTEPEIDWRIYSPKTKTSIETCASSTPPLLPLCDFPFGDSPSNSVSNISLDCTEFQDLFTSDSALNLEDLNVATSFSNTQKLAAERAKKKSSRNTADFITPLLESLDDPMNFAPIEPQLPTPPKESKRGRKRALSTTGLGRGGKASRAPAKPRKPRAPARPKKTPPPPKITNLEYNTHVGDPDLSWYFGLDPDIKIEDLDLNSNCTSTTVEVPRWREKPYTSSPSAEGTENLDDKAFEKRHQKLEAEERRQLRWHMRRIREQRHVEKLKQRHRDTWSTTVTAPAVYTVWPRPQRDGRFIELTKALPVNAFGEGLPNLPDADFRLPWVRSTKPLKRSKRSKTLH